jgi:hypothetical protein
LAFHLEKKMQPQTNGDFYNVIFGENVFEKLAAFYRAD